MASNPAISQQLELITERFEFFEKASSTLFKKYEAAIHQMVARFETLDADLEYRFNRNPIHHIESRLKRPRSVYEKLERQGYPLTIEAMEKNIMDIAGVRVICSYIDDVYALEKVLFSQDDLQLVRRKDYVANPKPNGYRSLHIIVKIPVYFLDRKQYVPVEIQMRTLAMDFWASLEHTIKYKRKDHQDDVAMYNELKSCSEIIEDVERRMQAMMHVIETSDVEEAARKRREQMREQALVTEQMELELGATSQFYKVGDGNHAAAHVAAAARAAALQASHEIEERARQMENELDQQNAAFKNAVYDVVPGTTGARLPKI